MLPERTVSPPTSPPTTETPPTPREHANQALRSLAAAGSACPDPFTRRQVLLLQDEVMGRLRQLGVMP